MKGKIPKILSVGLALVLVLSFSLVMAVPVSAVTELTISSPTNGSPVAIQPGSVLDVTFTFTLGGAVSAEATVEIYQGSTVLTSRYVEGLTSPATVGMPISVGADVGTYDVKVMLTETGFPSDTATEADAVVIDSTAPVVTGLTTDPGLITDDALGGAGFVVTVTFDDVMDEAVNPDVVFDPTLDTLLTNPVKTWADPQTYTVSYDVEDVAIEEGAVDIIVGGATAPKNLAGIQQAAAYTETAAFDVDTLNPTLDSIDWVNKDAPDTSITAGDQLVFTFSEAMDTTALDEAGELDTNLPPSTGTTYGASAIDWTVSDTVLTVTLGASVDVVKTDTIDPTEAVTDVADNADATDPAVAITQGAIVSVDLSETTVAPGGMFDATVTISSVVAFDTAEYDVTFDPDVVAVESITAGSIGGTPIPVTLWNDDGEGTVRVVQNVDGHEGVDGSGDLAVIHFTFTGSSGTSSDIDLADGTVMLGDNAANEIAAEISTSLPVTVSADLVVGDANGNGTVLNDVLDITYIEHVVAGTDGYEEYPGGDANEDGKYNVLDITVVEYLVAGLPLP